MDAYVQEFAKFGPVWLIIGITFACLVIAVIYLWRHNVTLQNKLFELYNTRIIEARETNAELMQFGGENHKVMVSITATMEALKDVILSKN